MYKFSPIFNIFSQIYPFFNQFSPISYSISANFRQFPTFWIKSIHFSFIKIQFYWYLTQIVADEDDVDAAESHLNDASERVDGDPVEKRNPLKMVSTDWMQVGSYLAIFPYLRSCLAPFLHAASATSA